MAPLLGWIAPRDRTQEQNDAHQRAMAKMPRFALQPPVNAGPVKVMLTDLWKDPLVVADVGFAFTGFRQLTGSCVGVSNGNAVFTVAAAQRKFSTNPTKAFLNFWPFAYGRTRFNENDRGQGEGAVDSVMGDTIGREGILEATQPGLPQFDRSDGLALTKQQELQWSDGGSPTVTKWMSAAAANTVGSRAVLSSVADIRTAILNGYPVLDGCDNYMGTGRIVGSGDSAYTRTQYDGRGGHSTCFLGCWDHPNDGPLYLYSNQWSGNTYPTDPAGGGRCTAWALESEVAKLFRSGGSGGETMALSHLNYFPARPEVLDWSTI